MKSAAAAITAARAMALRVRWVVMERARTSTPRGSTFIGQRRAGAGGVGPPGRAALGADGARRAGDQVAAGRAAKVLVGDTDATPHASKEDGAGREPRGGDARDEHDWVRHAGEEARGPGPEP